MPQIVTITFYQLEGFRDRFWALQQMQFGHGKLKGVSGLRFYRLLGSGRGNGFDWRPEWGRYAFLGVWENEKQARSFLSDHPFFREYRTRSSEAWTIFLRCVASHGEWGGEQPFDPVEGTVDGPIAVITRATIKPRFLWHFWRFVAPVAASLTGYRERLMSVGIGEWPIFMQATFSVWTNKSAMLDYAYKNPQHRAVVDRTRKLGWYKEELFARFEVLGTEGSWYGSDPVTTST